MSTNEGQTDVDKSNPSPFGLFRGKNTWGYCPCNAKVEDDKLRLFVAVFANILQPFTQIQQLNGEINPKSKCGCTPFHIAAGLGKVQICEFFLVNVEEKNPANKNGNTPLQFAVIEGQYTVCKVMVKFIKDLSPRDNNGFTPLHYAAQNGHLKICKLLVEKSKDPNPRCNQIYFLYWADFL